MQKLTILILYLMLFGCGGTPAPPTAILPKTGPDSGEIWLATYLAGMKVGYGLLKYHRTATGFNFDYVSRLTVGMMGKKQSVNAHSRVITGPDLLLRSFEFELGSQDGTFKAKGQVADERLLISTAEGSRTIQLTRRLYPVEVIGRLVVEANPVPGQRLNYLTFDGAVLDTFGTEVEVLGREMIKFGNEKLPALKLRVRRAQFDMTVWVDQAGMTLKEESALGMNSIRVNAEQALAGESNPTLDIMKLFAVPVDTIIPEGKQYHRAVLAISGVDTSIFKIGAENQQLIPGAEEKEIRVEVKIPAPVAGLKLPITAEPELLKPTITIQSTAPEIVNTARAIVGNTDDAVVATERIISWVFTSLKKEGVASLPSALEVLKQRKGDCNEHSVLFAALARAVGIPAKVVVGLLYLQGAFYYHAWNEVYLGNWVPVDATFGEFPAGALRLKLAEGDLSQQAKILGVVSKIRIRVLEFE